MTDKEFCKEIRIEIANIFEACKNCRQRGENMYQSKENPGACGDCPPYLKVRELGDILLRK